MSNEKARLSVGSGSARKNTAKNGKRPVTQSKSKGKQREEHHSEAKGLAGKLVRFPHVLPEPVT